MTHQISNPKNPFINLLKMQSGQIAMRGIFPCLTSADLANLFATSRDCSHSLQDRSLVLKEREIAYLEAGRFTFQSLQELKERIGDLTFAHYKMIRELDLTQSSPSEQQLIALLENCPNLAHLRFSTDVQITPPLIEAIGKIEKTLQSLELPKGTNDTILTAIAERCPNLKELNLNRCENVTDEGIGALARSCRRLEKLHIEGCYQITDRGIIEIAQCCPKLKDLDISGGVSQGITDESLIAIARHCKQFQKLNATARRGFTDRSFFLLAQLRTLTDLNLYSVHPLPVEGLILIAEENRLKSLNLSSSEIYSNRLTDEQLTKILKHCSDLESLHLQSLLEITDEGLSHLIQNKRLKTVWFPPGITDQGIGAIAEHCPRLETVLFMGPNAKATGKGIVVLAEKCKNLRQLTFEGHDCRDLATERGVQALLNSKNLTYLHLRFLDAFLYADKDTSLIDRAALVKYRNKLREKKKIQESRVYNLASVAAFTLLRAPFS